MSVIGDRFLVVVIVVTVAVVLATLLGWNAIRGPRPVRWLARLIMIGACQCTAVAVVAVCVNDSYGLYTSWDDVLGRHATPAPAVVAAASPPPVEFADAGGGVLRTHYRGIESGLRGRILVWTPPEYGQDAYRDYRFPVIVLLHGVPGSPEAWIEGGGATTLLPEMMRTGLLRPAILVMPQVDPGVNTDCTDVPGGPQTATWLAHDVPRLIATHFRTLDQATGWAVAGDSTGGYCAAKLALQYPKRFATALAIAPDDFHGDPAVLASASLRRANDPVQLAARGAVASILVATSARDEFSTPANAEALFAAARPPTVVDRPLIVADGGHNWGTWQAMYPAIFSWLSAHLSPPQPAPPRRAGALSPPPGHPSAAQAWTPLEPSSTPVAPGDPAADQDCQSLEPCLHHMREFPR